MHSTIKTQAPEMIPIKVNAPWDLVGIDLVGPLAETKNGNKYFMSCTDYFTKGIQKLVIIKCLAYL